VSHEHGPSWYEETATLFAGQRDQALRERDEARARLDVARSALRGLVDEVDVRQRGRLPDSLAAAVATARAALVDA
jgi:hypothetical protein